MNLQNVMVAEQNKDDATLLALVIHGKRFVAAGVTPENAEEFKKTMGRVMMAVNVHLEETDEDIKHNTKRAEIYMSGVEVGASLAAPSVKVKDYAIKRAREIMLERKEKPN